MIFGEGFLGIALIFLWIFCIFDVITTPPEDARNMPKVLWLLVVLIVPDVGSVAWLVLGRPRRARVSFAQPRPPRTEPTRGRPRGPEDSPQFMSGIDEQHRLRAWEDELRKREEEIRRREQEE
jgi:phospholipase D-like protein